VVGMKHETVTSSKPEDHLNDLKTTAQRLAISVWTVRRWCQTGRLASVKLGTRRLIAEAELQRVMAEGLR
jgi:excisionase family DNA binding protein